MLGKRTFGALQGWILNLPCVGPLHQGSDYFMILFYSLSGAAGGAGSKVRAHGAPQRFLFLPQSFLHLQPLTFSFRAPCLLQALHPWTIFLITASISSLAPSP